MLRFLIITLLIVGCSEPSVTKQRGTKRDYPDQESWGSIIILSENDRLLARAESERMVKYEAREEAYLVGDVVVDFYDDGGRHVSRMTADSAEVDMSTNSLEAFGDVVVHSDSGLTLYTESLRLDEQLDMIHTSDSIRFTSAEQDTLYGIGFESDVDLSHWRIFQPWGVTGRRINIDG